VVLQFLDSTIIFLPSTSPTGLRRCRERGRGERRKKRKRGVKKLCPPPTILYHCRVCLTAAIVLGERKGKKERKGDGKRVGEEGRRKRRISLAQSTDRQIPVIPTLNRLRHTRLSFPVEKLIRLGKKEEKKRKRGEEKKREKKGWEGPSYATIQPANCHLSSRTQDSRTFNHHVPSLALSDPGRDASKRERGKGERRTEEGALFPSFSMAVRLEFHQPDIN